MGSLTAYSMCVILPFSIFLVLGGIACGDEGNEPTELAKGYLATRMEIWAGDLEVSYRRWSPSYEDIGKWISKFDQRQNGRYFRHLIGDKDVQFVETNEHQLIFDKADGMLKKRSIDADYLARLSVPFDVRCVGIVNGGEWDRRLTYDGMKDFLLGTKVNIGTAKSEMADHSILRWTGSPDPADGSYWIREVSIDLKRGLVPVVIKEGVAKKTIPGPRRLGALVEFVSVIHEATFDWLELDGVWVPQKWSYQEFKGTQAEQGAEYTFVWNSVNTALDDELFSQDVLNVPKGTRIVNEMIEKQPFIEEIVGGMQGEVQGNSIERSYVKVSWILIANVVVFGVMFAFFSIRIWRSRNIENIAP